MPGIIPPERRIENVASPRVSDGISVRPEVAHGACDGSTTPAPRGDRPLIRHGHPAGSGRRTTRPSPLRHAGPWPRDGRHPDHRTVWPDGNAGREDILLHKLAWYQLGDPVSDRQWGDLAGVVKVQADSRDGAYLRHWGGALGVFGSPGPARGRWGTPRAHDANQASDSSGGDRGSHRDTNARTLSSSPATSRPLPVRRPGRTASRSRGRSSERHRRSPEGVEGYVEGLGPGDQQRAAPALQAGVAAPREPPGMCHSPGWPTGRR